MKKKPGPGIYMYMYLHNTIIKQYVIWTRMTRNLWIAPFIVKHFFMYWMNYYSIFCIYFLKCYKPWCHIGTNFIVYFTFMFYIQKYTFVSVLPLSVKLFFTLIIFTMYSFNFFIFALNFLRNPWPWAYRYARLAMGF